MKPASLYFIAIIPDQKVRDEITSLKHEAAEKFDSKAALRSPPHITLHMPFRWKDAKQEVLLAKLQQFRFPSYPLKVELKNFAFFPPRVVYINVEKSEMLGQLQNQLTTHMRRELNIFNADYKDRAFHPHMTIAFRDLKKSRYTEAFDYYSNKNYEALFEINNICLLKHDGKKWDELRYFS